MNKKIQLLYTLFIFTIPLFAQKTEPIVATIDGQEITVAEFDAALKRGGVKRTKSEIKDFLNTYIDFKLNVTESLAERLDTTERYRRDLKSSRILLSKPYAIDTTEQNIPYIKNLYDRMQEDAEINQVVLKFDKNPYFPSDTLALYNKALALREEILSKGFDGVDYDNKIQSSSILSNNTDNYNGYLGWVSPLMLPPAVSRFVYSTPTGSISMPLRSNKGYHIIQVLAKRKTLGDYKIDMIPFPFPYHPTAAQKDSVKHQVENVYKSLQTTYTFDDLSAAYLQALDGTVKDYSLGYINYDSQLPHSFINEVFKLNKAGDISSPIETENGYCLVRLTDIAIPRPYSIREQNRIIKNISKSQYLLEYLRSVNEKYNNSFDLQINSQSYKILEDAANMVYPEDTLFLSSIKNLDLDLFSIEGKKTYKVRNFAYYMDALSRMLLPDPESSAPPALTVEEAVRIPLSTDKLSNLLDRYTTARVSLYADSTLEDRNPKFAKEMQAISEDLLVYEVLDKHVLQPSKSREALESYFIKNKAKYDWTSSHFKGYILYGNNKEALKNAKKIITDASVNTNVSLQLKELINTQSGLISVENGIWQKGENKFVDYKEFDEKNTPTLPDGITEYEVVGHLQESPESYRDVISQVEDDYENVLRNQWNNKLRNKYTVIINDAALKRIK